MRGRIFLGLTDIAGYYSQLEDGLRERGWECTFVNAYPSISYIRTRRPTGIAGLVERVAEKRVALRRGAPLRLLLTAVQGFALSVLLVRALFKYDTFVFASGISFLRGLDLPVLRLFGKRIIAVFHGSDSRPPFLNGAFAGTEGPIDTSALVAASARIRSWVNRVGKNAHVIVDHPPSAHYHSRPIVQWLAVGIPVRRQRNLEVWNGRPRIVHAPTRPGPKGSALIDEAIARLRAEGYAFEYVKLVGVPHSTVMDELARADFVVDELFSDTTMAMFAAEAASLGKPAVVGSYAAESLKRLTPPALLPPAYICTAEDVYSAIKYLLDHPNERRRLGQTAFEFVCNTWSPAQVAQRFERVIAGDIPESWLWNPRDADYFHGWGLSNGRSRAVIRKLVEERGRQSLQFPEPSVEQRALAFAGLVQDGVERAG